MVRSLIVVALVGPTSLLFSPAAEAQCCKGQATACGADGTHSGESAAATDQLTGAGGVFLAAAPPQETGEKAAGRKAERGFLPAYFRIWKALGKDELKGIPEAKRDLVSALQASAKTTPKGLAEKDRSRRAKLLASAQEAASKLDVSDLKKARDGFGVLSSELRKLIESFSAEGDAYVVYCDMAKKSWLQDSPKVLNPYYGSSMSGCGQVVRKPTSVKTFTCPMHTAYRSEEPGDCPTCGMKLVPLPEEKHVDPHAGRADPHAVQEGHQH